LIVIPADDEGRMEMTTSQRRVAAIGVGGILVVAAIAALAIAGNGGSGASSGTTSTSATTGNTAAMPATPEIRVVAPVRRTSAPSSVIEVLASSNAGTSGVTHYEVWRRDESVKNDPWTVVSNIQHKQQANKFVYTDTDERAGDRYAFRVVAVTDTMRSQYEEIQVVAKR
jgi:hypothetical protein